MPMIAGTNYAYIGQVKRPRPGPRGTVKPTKGAFNNFPAIIGAFPDALSAIVVTTTELLGEMAADDAPVLENPRRGDPAPGNLKASKRTRYYKRRGTDLVQTGRLEFPAVDPRGHRYAKPLETTSIRRTRRGLIRVTKGSGWLVRALQDVRPFFNRHLANLESRLPH